MPFQPFTGAGPWLAAVRRCSPNSPPRSVPTSSSPSTVPTRTPGIRSRTCGSRRPRWTRRRGSSTGHGTGTRRPLARDRRRRLRRLPGRPADVEPGLARRASRGPGGPTAEAWRARWAGEAVRYHQAPLPGTFLDLPNAGLPVDHTQALAEAMSMEMADLVRRVVVPKLQREARARGWWGSARERGDGQDPPGRHQHDRGAAVTVIADVRSTDWAGRTLADRVVAPFEAATGHAIVTAALAPGRERRRGRRWIRGRRAGGRRAGRCLARPRRRSQPSPDRSRDGAPRVHGPDRRDHRGRTGSGGPAPARPPRRGGSAHVSRPRGSPCPLRPADVRSVDQLALAATRDYADTPGTRRSPGPPWSVSRGSPDAVVDRQSCS